MAEQVKITPKKKRISDDLIKEALIATGGIQAAASRWLMSKKNISVDRTTICKRLKKSSELREAVEEATEILLDVAEGGLAGHIKNGNLTAIIFFLKCKGKKRGYVERQEVTGADGAPVVDRSLRYDLSGVPAEELSAMVREAFKADKSGESGGGKK